MSSDRLLRGTFQPASRILQRVSSLVSVTVAPTFGLHVDPFHSLLLRSVFWVIAQSDR